MIFITKQRKLNASASLNTSKNSSFFQDLYWQYKEWDGMEIPSADYQNCVLDMEVSEDALEIQVHSGDTKLLHFDAYYIEDDEYGDPVYDIYSDEGDEEGISEDQVGYALDDWFTKLRQYQIGLRDEADEDAFLENRSSMDPRIVKLDYLRTKIFRTVDSRDVRRVMQEQIDDDMLKPLLPKIADDVFYLLEDEASGDRCKLIACQYQEGSKQGRIQVTYEIFGKPFKKAVGVFKRVKDKFFYGGYEYHDSEYQTMDYFLKDIENHVVATLKTALTKVVKELWVEYAEGIFNPDANIIASPYATWFPGLHVYAEMNIKLEDLKIPRHLVGNYSRSFQTELDKQQSQALLDLPYNGSTLRNFISLDPSIFDHVLITIIKYEARDDKLIFQIALTDKA